jgi:dCMP deaminase
MPDGPDRGADVTVTESSPRKSWSAYYGDIATTVATRATCSRRKVGAVIVQGRRIVSTGYNGVPKGMVHCDEGGCPRAASDTPKGSGYDSADHPCYALHAEQNALLFSSPEEREGASLYCTDAPCFGCAKLIANSGVTEVVAFGGLYDGWPDVRAFLLAAGVRVRVFVDGQLVNGNNAA